MVHLSGRKRVATPKFGEAEERQRYCQRVAALGIVRNHGAHGNCPESVLKEILIGLPL